MCVGRLLRAVFLGGKARAFYKADNRRGEAAKFFTGFARGNQVLLGLFDAIAAAATHKGVIQRPPGKAQQRNVNQLALDEKFDKRDFSIEGFLQNQNVDPALMVANQQIPIVGRETVGEL